MLGPTGRLAGIMPFSAEMAIGVGFTQIESATGEIGRCSDILLLFAFARYTAFREQMVYRDRRRPGWAPPQPGCAGRFNLRCRTSVRRGSEEGSRSGAAEAHVGDRL